MSQQCNEHVYLRVRAAQIHKIISEKERQKKIMYKHMIHAVLDILCYNQPTWHTAFSLQRKARFPLPELTARDNGPS